MEERERSPLPRDAFSFAFFLSSLFSLSLSFLKRARPNRKGGVRSFCGLLSAFSFFFSKIRESSLTLSRAVARVFKFFHQRSSSEKKKRRRREIQKRKKKKERRRERARLEKTRLSLSLFWWCLAAQKTPIDASAARASRFRLLLLLLLLLPSLPSRDERDDDDIFFWCAFFLLCCFFDPFFY